MEKQNDKYISLIACSPVQIESTMKVIFELFRQILVDS